MSLHPEIIGIHLDRLFALLASRDASVAKAVGTKIDRLSKHHGSSFCDVMRQTLATALASGVPIAGLITETDPHVCLADMLARYRQSPVDTESYDWKFGAFFEFDRVCGKQLGRDGRKLFSYLLKGRPLFGKTIKASVSYAYLTGDEADVLTDCMRQVNTTDPMAEELASSFVEWMEMIRPKRDVWCHVG